MYWGKYVQHDNNRDGMGQYLKITQNIHESRARVAPDRRCTICTRRSRTSMFRPAPALTTTRSIRSQVNEWWLLAETEMMEMAKRGVPGVFTYGFYDGWVPNYLFWIALTHNSFGRFYEVQSYGPDNNAELRLPAHRHQPRMVSPESAAAAIKWGPRNNTNIQESAMLFAMHKVAQDKRTVPRELLHEEQARDRKGQRRPDLRLAGSGRAAAQGRMPPTGQCAAASGRGSQQARMRRIKAGDTDVAAGDYIIRADQPYRTLVDMYLSVQNYPPANPRPYDDTGWTMQYMRNVKVMPVRE